MIVKSSMTKSLFFFLPDTVNQVSKNFCMFYNSYNLYKMVNQVTIKLKTIKGEWSTTFQKSTRVKDVILALKVHFRLPKDGIYTGMFQFAQEEDSFRIQQDV